jgi:hypothetical protein
MMSASASRGRKKQRSSDSLAAQRPATEQSARDVRRSRLEAHRDGLLAARELGRDYVASLDMLAGLLGTSATLATALADTRFRGLADEAMIALQCCSPGRSSSITLDRWHGKSAAGEHDEEKRGGIHAARTEQIPQRTAMRQIHERPPGTHITDRARARTQTIPASSAPAAREAHRSVPQDRESPTA